MAEQHAPPPPMTGGKLALATVAIGLANFMVVLDTTIANVSVPTISGSLAVAPSQGTWVITSYSVAEAITVPLTGWLVARFGTVRLFIMALIGFALMSLACGFAGSLESLVLFRVLQGIAGGPLIPLSQALLFASYPREKVGVGQGVWGMTTIIGPIVGPILGGYISDNYSWPWIFFINIPVGALVVYLAYRLFRDRETPVKKLPVDRVGLALVVISVGSLQVMLDKGKELDWFGSPLIVALAVIAAVGFLFLIAWELTDEHPIVDLRLFGNWNFSIAVIALSLIFGVFFGSIVLLPQWLQTYMGYTATWSGLAQAPNGVLAVLLAPVVGRFGHKADPRILVTLSLLIFMTTFGMRADFTADVDFGTIALPQFIQGLAMVLFILPLTQISLGSLPNEKIASGSGLQNFVRTTVAAFAASLTTTLWDDQIQRHHAQLAEHITAYDPGVQNMLRNFHAQGYSDAQSLALLDRMVSGQSVILATTDYFAYAVPMFACLIVLVWMARRQTLAAPIAGGH